MCRYKYDMGYVSSIIYIKNSMINDNDPSQLLTVKLHYNVLLFIPANLATC